MRRASDVVVIRVWPPIPNLQEGERHEMPPPTGKVSLYTLVSQPVLISRTGDHGMRAIIGKFRINPVQNRCAFNPGMDVRFIRGQDKIDVLVCFDCDEFQIFRDDKSVGQKVWFSPEERKSFVQLAKQMFPEDADIQSLSDIRK